MGLAFVKLEPGISPHEYMRRKHPNYKYIDKSMSEHFLTSKQRTLKYDNIIIVTAYDGMNYLFRKGG